MKFGKLIELLEEYGHKDEEIHVVFRTEENFITAEQFHISLEHRGDRLYICINRS